MLLKIYLQPGRVEGAWGVRVRGRNGKMSDHSRLSKVETNDSEETVRLVELWLKHANLLGKG